MSRVMGIVNVTPDSFSDGGKYFTPDEAIRRANNLVREGADILDLGGESTRPEATPIGWDEEWARLEPVLTGLALSVPISIDTYHPETATRAIAAGASIINCVRSESIPEMLGILVAHPHVELVMPVRTPADLPPSPDLRNRLYLDPMIGFGTTRDEDLARLHAIPALAREGRVLVGVSRKRIVKKLTGVKIPGKDIAGNLALAVWCVMAGARVVRVHDVSETVQALRVIDQMQGEPIS